MRLFFAIFCSIYLSNVSKFFTLIRVNYQFCHFRCLTWRFIRSLRLNLCRFICYSFEFNIVVSSQHRWTICSISTKNEAIKNFLTTATRLSLLINHPPSSPPNVIALFLSSLGWSFRSAVTSVYENNLILVIYTHKTFMLWNKF